MAYRYPFGGDSRFGDGLKGVRLRGWIRGRRGDECGWRCERKSPDPVGTQLPEDPCL